MFGQTCCINLQDMFLLLDYFEAGDSMFYRNVDKCVLHSINFRRVVIFILLIFLVISYVNSGVRIAQLA
jgi:hypothetical protein